MTPRKNIAPGVTGGDAKKAHDRNGTTPDFEMCADETYYIHVSPDGTEHITADEPRGQKSLLVERMANWEHTRTRNIMRESHFGTSYIQVPPKGEGWERFEDHSDKWTGWRRRLRGAL